jgi:hypothetical protein
MTEKKKFLMGESGPSSAGWHKIESGLRCMKEYQYATVRNIQVPAQFEPPYFTIGRMLHAGKARWFARRFKTGTKTMRLIQEAMEAEAENGRLPAKAECLPMASKYMAAYVEHWKSRPLPEPVAAEHLVGPAPVKPGSPVQFHRTARLDDVSYYPEAAGQLCIGETKSTSDSIQACLDQYTLHGQPLLQRLLYKYAPQGEALLGPVAGVVLDVIQKGYGNQASKFGRIFIPVTDHALNWFANNLEAQMRALAMIDWDADAPRNITMCTRMAGRKRVICDYRDLCIHGKSASVKYTFGDGKSLLTHKPTAEKNRMPWE